MASDSFQFDQTSLEWQTWTGFIQKGAVSIYNDKCKRTEYVAKHGLQAGFYCPSLGPFCHYATEKKEHLAATFDILVNKDNFEVLEWKPDSHGKVPENAVRTIQGEDTYVARAKYGLGEVRPVHKAFFYPWKGKEHRYKKYEVLTFSRNIIKDEIVDVKYTLDVVKIIQHPPEIISRNIIVNKDSHPATQTTELKQSIAESNSWGTDSKLAITTSATMTAGLPNIGSIQTGFSTESSFGFNKGSTQTKSMDVSRSIKVDVPAKHSCTVRMEARMLSADIPFTAQLRRTYQNGKTTCTIITGTYKGVRVAEVQSVVEPCVPLK